MAKLVSGFNIHVVFGTTSDLVLCCTSVKDPGFDSGDDIDITSNCSVGARETAPADLGAPTDLTLTARYDPEDRAKLQAAIGVPQQITVEYRKCKNRAVGEKVVYDNAWIRSWDPQEMTIGEMPTIQVIIGIAGGTSSGDASDYHPEGAWSTLA